MKTDTKSASNIDEYINVFPSDVKVKLQKIREIIQKAAPDAEEAIKYQIPTFVLNGNLVHFAAFQKHIGFYPTSSGIAEFKDELTEYKSAKGSVQFPLDAPVPYSLITKIVKFRFVVESSRLKLRRPRPYAVKYLR